MSENTKGRKIMEYILEYIITIFLSLFEVYIIFRYMNVFFGDKYYDKKILSLVYILYFSYSVIMNNSDMHALLGAAISFATIFCISLCYRAKFSKHFISSFLIYMCSFIAETIVALIMNLSHFSILGKINHVSSFISFLINVIFFMILLIIEKFNHIKHRLDVPKKVIIAVLIIPVSIACLVIAIFSQDALNRIMADLSLVCLVASVVVLVYLYDSLSELFSEKTKAAIAIREKEYYNQQAVLLAEKYDELRQYRHDMKNRMISMQQMLQKKQYDALRDYMEKAAQKLEKTFTYSNTGNIALDSVINYKVSKMVESGIDVEINIALPETLEIDEDDFVIIIGNLLDNAAEAAGKINNSSKKYIYMDFEYDMGSVWICVKNNFENEIKMQGDKFITGKKDKNIHGIGLQSVRSTIEKYNGQMDVSVEGNIFVVNIILYL